MNQGIQVSCPSCSKEGVSSFGESMISGRLRWYRSTSCPTCGHIEEDGDGFPPAEYREQLLEAGGCWRLVVDTRFRVRAQKILRSALELSLEESAAIGFPEVFVGTKAEVEWLAAKMLAGGMTVRTELRSPESDGNGPLPQRI